MKRLGGGTRRNPSAPSLPIPVPRHEIPAGMPGVDVHVGAVGGATSEARVVPKIQSLRWV